MVKLSYFCMLVVSAVLLAGCGGEQEPEAASMPSSPEAPSINLTDATPGGEGSAAPAAPEAPEIPPQSADISAEGLVTKDAEGNALDKTAQLQQAVDYYTRVLEPKVPESEEEAKTFKGYPPLTDLEQLVKARVIRAVPAAPAGKKYVIENGKVKLVAQ